ncbi:hypothetical protein MKW98_024204 [Papaver atlanticum]|uniref:3'-5' exonuclease domain-containing protein n=1 Tax=Papaver atlanticum TaxID=357466 RepID=A0AAD4SXZ4_9MAGN|nr:hypothetical protein MKW98_024204 [Papaver atlanticum]
MFTYSPIHYSEEEEEKEEEESIHTSERRVYGLNRRTRIFDVSFFGKSITTTVTFERREIRRWIYSNLYYNRRNRYNLVVGLGVQWLPFSSDDPAETLQICIGTRCLIIQLSHTRYLPKFLQRFLDNEKITFVGIWIIRSFHYHNIDYLLGNESSSGSMENLIRDYLGFKGVRKDEIVGRSNWNAKNLSVDQVQYATVDAHASF